MKRDKILVLCQNRSQINDQLEILFKQPLPLQDCIVKGIFWENKYYGVEFDLYIDEIEIDLKDWIVEFNSDECEPLRKVVAGIIVILPLEDRVILQLIESYLIHRDSDNTDEEQFIVCCDPSLNSRRYPHWDEFTSLEITTLSTSNEKNEYGELEGIPRIQEIIDTYPWTHSTLKQNQKQSSSGSSTDIELHHIIAKLQSAKLEFAKNQDENMALEISEEIAKMVSNQ